MKIHVIKDADSYSFYKIYLPIESGNVVIVEEAYLFQVLKVVGNPEKYFNYSIIGAKYSWLPKIELWNHKKKEKTISLALCKKTYINLSKNDPKFYNSLEQSNLNKIFKIKDSGNLLSARGWHKEHNNYNAAEKWERVPAKRKTPARNVVKAKKAVKAKKK